MLLPDSSTPDAIDTEDVNLVERPLACLEYTPKRFNLMGTIANHEKFRNYHDARPCSEPLSGKSDRGMPHGCRSQLSPHQRPADHRHPPEAATPEAGQGGEHAQAHVRHVTEIVPQGIVAKL